MSEYIEETTSRQGLKVVNACLLGENGKGKGKKEKGRWDELID